MFHKTVSVIIPTHRSSKSLITLIRQFNDKDVSCLREIIVVVDRPDPTYEEKIGEMKMQLPFHIVHTNGRIGASRARNLGVSLAVGDIVLFLDSDVMPNPGIVYEHYCAYATRNSSSTIGVAGITKFTPNGNKFLDSCILECSLLYPFTHALRAKEVYWAPTSNLSFLRNEISKEPFDIDFPAMGGGEDVFLCLNAIQKNRKLISAPRALVRHKVWSGMPNILHRFFRWGYADALLIKKCKQNQVGTNRIRIPSTSVAVIILTLLACTKAFLADSLYWLSSVPTFIIFSWLCLSILKWFRHRSRGGINASFLNLAGATAFLYVYDAGCIAGRLCMGGKYLFREIVLFPRDLDIYRHAKWRMFSVNSLLMAIAILSMIFL